MASATASASTAATIAGIGPIEPTPGDEPDVLVATKGEHPSRHV
jgi:hypothetical protein